MVCVLRKIWHTIEWFMKKINDSDVDAWSGQSAFFIIISFFPFVLLLVSLLRTMHIAESQIMGELTALLPSAVLDFILNVVNEATSHGETAIVSVSVIAALWAISRSMFAVTKGLCSVYETEETRNYFLTRIISFFYTIAFFVVLAITLLILVFGGTLATFLVQLFPQFKATALLILTFRSIVAAVVLTLMFLLMYKVLPNNPMRLRELLPGALFTSLGWLIFSRLFSFYIDNFSNYSNLYGSLTAIVLLMLWLYFCMYILFLGGTVNMWLRSIREKD